MPDRVASMANDLGEAMARIQSLLRKEMTHHGVSLAQARTLATLQREGPRPLTDLAALEQVSQPSMSYLVARMEANGHVGRSSNADDGRVVIVSITDAGRTLLNGLLNRRAEFLREHLAHLSTREIAALETVLPVLAHLVLVLEDRRAVASSH
jgi:DNA-binding MarR family transcriptional regulator